MALQTEYPFELPRGYVDSSGKLHKHGIMRLATAADEILPMRDPRAIANPSYVTIITLARVIIRLGDLDHMDTTIIENLFAADFTFLQEFYLRLNQGCTPCFRITCPACGKEMALTPQALFEK